MDLARERVVLRLSETAHPTILISVPRPRNASAHINLLPSFLFSSLPSAYAVILSHAFPAHVLPTNVRLKTKNSLSTAYDDRQPAPALSPSPQRSPDLHIRVPQHHRSSPTLAPVRPAVLSPKCPYCIYAPKTRSLSRNSPNAEAERTTVTFSALGAAHPCPPTSTALLAGAKRNGLDSNGHGALSNRIERALRAREAAKPKS